MNISPALKKLLAACAIVVGFCAGVLIMRGAGLFSFIWLFGLAGLTILAFINRAAILAFVKRKLQEWRNDARQLGLWLRLAFTRDRDAQATAAMTHQMHFLQGRIASPMNLFAIAAIVVVLSLGGLGFQEWRINRVKRERDAACSQTELSLNNRGEYRTSRESCATLGRTLDVVIRWRDHTTRLQEKHDADIAFVRSENAGLIEAERRRREASAAAAARQRRRENERITTALGGPAPDLERSVCELAGGDNCGASATGDAPATPAAGDLPVGPGSAGNAADPRTAAADPAAGRDE